jgi:hypothetical protein
LSLSGLASFSSIDNSERQIAVGDGDLFSADVVANRPGAGAGAARADEQPAGLGLDLRDRAAARADGFDVDDRLLHAKALNDRFLGVAPVAFGDETDVEARAAHVRGNNVLVPEQAGDVGGGDHTAGRAGL